MDVDSAPSRSIRRRRAVVATRLASRRRKVVWRRKSPLALPTAGGRVLRGAMPSVLGSQELKYVDTAISAIASTDGTAADTIILLNNVNLGDTSITRDGNRIALKSLEVRGRIVASLADTLPHEVRLIVFWDSSPNGAGIPTWAQVMTAQNASSGFPNVAGKSRFTIISDTSMPIGTFVIASGNASAPVVHTYHKYFPLSVAVQYSTATGTDINSGALYFAVLGTGTVVSSDTSTFTGAARVRFVDS